ncbi:MAG: PAS domain S-box protein [Victivallaceae bacterium]|jgi:PAS domain S-box-containing protein
MFFFKLKLLVMIFIAGFTISCGFAAGQQEIRIGVLALRGKDICQKLWEPTAAFLSSNIPEYKFKIVPLAYSEVNDSVKNKKVDFILVNSSIYVTLEMDYNVSRIASMEKSYKGNYYNEYGGIIFCLQSNKSIDKLSDLKGKSFIASDETSFGGWQMAWRLLQQNNINPYRDFSSVRFGGTNDAAVMAVKAGQADAGTVTSGILESMISEGRVNPDDFKIIHRVEYPARRFPLLCSTQLYPEWPFAELEHVPHGLGERVMVALMQMKPEDNAAVAAGIAGWTAPLNYNPVNECLKELRIGPYEGYGRVTLAAFWKEYRLWVIFGFIFFCMIMFFLIYVYRVNYQLRKSAMRVEEELAERKRIEDKLRYSEDMYRSLVEAIPDLVWLKSPDGLYISCNPAFERLFGQKKSDIIGRSNYDFFDTVQADFFRAYDEKVMATGKSCINEEWLSLADNGFRGLFEVIKTPMHNANGDITGVLGIARDITARKQTENALAEANKLNENTINAIDDIFYVFDCNGILLRWNQACNRVSGYSDAELSSKKISEFFAGEDVARIAEAVKKMWTEDKVKIEANYVIRSGKAIPYELTGSILKNAGGDVTGFVGIGRDITERIEASARIKQELAERKRAEEEIRQIFNTAGDGMRVVSRDHKIVEANEQYLKMSGLPRAEVIGHYCHEFSVCEEKHCGLKDCTFEKMLDLPRRTEYDFILKTKTESIPCIVTSVPYRDKDGKVIGMIQNFKDIRDRLRAEKASEQEAEQRGRALMAGSVLHDIGNAITGVGTLAIKHIGDGGWPEIKSVSMLRKMFNEQSEAVVHAFGKEKITKLLAFLAKLEESLSERKNNILETSRKMANLVSHINDVLSLQRIYAGGSKTLPSSVSLKQLADDAVSMLSASLQKRAIEVVFKVEPDIQEIKVDKTRIIQVLINLLKNATESFDIAGRTEDRRIEIALRQEIQQQIMEITDNAAGFDPAQAARFFENGFSTKNRGSGIGLYQCASIIKSHGGKIELSSPGLEQGAAVKITLPLEITT